MKNKISLWAFALFLFGTFFLSRPSSATVDFVMGPNEYAFLLSKSGTAAVLCNPQRQGYSGNVYEVECKLDDVISGKGLQKGGTYTLRFATNKGFATRFLQLNPPSQFVVGRPELLFVQTNAAGHNTYIVGENQARFVTAPGADGKLQIWNGLNNSNLFNQKEAVGNPMMMKMWEDSSKAGTSAVRYDDFKNLIINKMKGGN